MPSAADSLDSEAWVARLSPWPEDGFGLERMRALLRELGDPQDAYEAVHIVGTNGKSTAALTVEALLRASGLRGRHDDLAPCAAVVGADPRRRRRGGLRGRRRAASGPPLNA